MSRVYWTWCLITASASWRHSSRAIYTREKPARRQRHSAIRAERKSEALERALLEKVSPRRGRNARTARGHYAVARALQLTPEPCLRASEFSPARPTEPKTVSLDRSCRESRASAAPAGSQSVVEWTVRKLRSFEN